RTLHGWALADEALTSIVEKDGLGQHLAWVGGQPTLSAHPLASCRMGDDPATSALTPNHEVRGKAGLFGTDGGAAPTSLPVNPSVRIGALGERASVVIVQRAREAGIAVHASVPPPGN